MTAKHSPGNLRVSEFDGTTVGLSNHTGVASTAPDPLCREHYRGGPFRGHHFAPVSDVEVQKANAARIALTWNAHDALVESLLETARTVQELLLKDPRLLDDYDQHGLLRRARDALKLAGEAL